MRFKLLSLNVRGLCSPSKVHLLCQELELLKYDVFLLQETHVSCRDQAEAVERVWRGKFSANFSGSVERFIFDSDGRILSLLFQVNSFKLNLI